MPAEALQEEIRAFGFWIYLMSDLLLFGALFAIFAVMARNAHAIHFELREVFIETMLLLASSATYGVAMIELRKEKSPLPWLGATFLFGLGFVLIEAREFSFMIEARHGPWESGYLSAFFTLVGAHGAHVSCGLFWMLVMMLQILILGPTAQVRMRLQCLGMFWHFLDIVWIGVFTVVYLAGAAR